MIGNDLTVTLAAEGGQLQLNAFEPTIGFCILQSMRGLTAALNTLTTRCVRGITADRERCRGLVMTSIGIITALNPVLGYEVCSRVAKAALESGRGVVDIVLEEGLLSESHGRGVMVVLNDQVHAARYVYKTNTTQVDTFRSPDRGPVGHVETAAPELWESPGGKHTTSSEFSVEGVDALPKVDIVYAYANMGRELIDAAVNAGAKGIVVAGVGNGNMTAEALQALSDARRKGVVVVRSTRLPSGEVTRNAEVNDDELGFVASEQLKPAKARVLLKLALTRTADPGQIQQMFRDY